MAHPFKSQAKDGRATARSRYADGGSVERRILFDPTPMNPSTKTPNERVKSGFEDLTEEDGLQAEVGPNRTRLNRKGYRSNPIV